MGSKCINITAVLALAGVILSCGERSFDAKEELWTYLKESKNGYHFTKTVNKVDYALTYKPTDLLVEQELGLDYSGQKVNEFRKKYGNYLYFNLSISSKGQELLNHKVGNQAEFGALVGQLAFNMGEKIHLISQKRDTLQLIDYSYPRLYGLSKSTDLLLIYEKDTSSLQQDYLLFTIEDFGFETGEVSLKIDTKKIRQQPILNLKDQAKQLENQLQLTSAKELDTNRKM